MFLGACGGDAVRDDALRVVIPREPEELDPRFVGDPYGLRLTRLLFASLVRIDSRTLEVVPDLAERIENETPTRYRVTLRDGLRFSDGSALDADDVIATYESVVDPRLASRYASTYARVTKIERLDARTVLFEIDAPHATFITDLELPILRAEDRSRHVGADDLVGAGPYVLSSYSSRGFALAPNPHWHRGAPRYPHVRMTVVHDDNTRALRMLAGEADLALSAIPPMLVPLFEDERFEIESAPGIGTLYVGFELETPILNDVRVREAIAHAIDREALVRAKLGGRGLLAKSWIPPGHWAYDPETPSYDHSPARARQLLDEAGVIDPDGAGPAPRASFVLRTSSERFRVSVARAIAAMLGEVGLEIEVRPSDDASLRADLGRGRFELCILQVPEVFEPHVLSWFFSSDRIPGGGNEGANRWRFRNARADAAMERGRANLEREVRVEAYRDVQRILAEELPVLPLWHEDVVAIVGPRARGFDVPRDGRFSTLAD
jgi:peptide/nickel transport system substrate-binding protein